MQCPYPLTVPEQPYSTLTIWGGGDKWIPKHCLFKKTHLTFGEWNGQTLMDEDEKPEYCITIVAKMLNWYQADIAALRKTRFAGEIQLDEVRGGYTFFCIGNPYDAQRISGVGFAILPQL